MHSTEIKPPAISLSYVSVQCIGAKEVQVCHCQCGWQWSSLPQCVKIGCTVFPRIHRHAVIDETTLFFMSKYVRSPLKSLKIRGPCIIVTSSKKIVSLKRFFVLKNRAVSYITACRWMRGNTVAIDHSLHLFKYSFNIYEWCYLWVSISWW